ncbi:MAG: phospholipase D-like domain-containing protein [Pseudomonadota bacterium]
MLTQGEACWRIETADRAALIVDADNYFRAAATAMAKARDSIMMVGWDFDARIRLTPGHDDMPDETLGDFIYRLVKENPRLDIYLLRWRFGAWKILVRGSTILTLIKWFFHPRIHLRLDGRHPSGSSHHQKIVVIDDSLAFCGGIDMTADRWDTRAHDDDEPRRTRPSGQPYGPWHDATCALHGDVARALGDVVRLRWRHAGGGDLPEVADENDCWPDDLEPQFRDVDIGIARTLPDMPDWQAVHEIEALYIAQIEAAERYIYAESQYFASHAIARAMAERLDEPNGPEIVIVNPRSAEGWLEPIAMDSARARLFEALSQGTGGHRLKIYHPVTAAGAEIYVHAKIFIVDDRIVRIGSSNLNNRSMRLDTECDVVFDGARPANHGYEDQIRAILTDLIGEHLDMRPADVDAALRESGSLIDTIEALRHPVGDGRRTLEPYTIPDLDAVHEFVADNQILDPEGPDQMFETFKRRKLLRGLLGQMRERITHRRSS